MAGLPSHVSRRSPMQNAAAAFFTVLISFYLFGLLPTQWFAAHYAYDPNLGVGLFHVGSIVLYKPTEWIFWGLHFADVQGVKESVHVLLFLGAASFILAILFGAFVAYRLARYSEGMSGLHGTAHWSEKEDIYKTAFVDTKGHKSAGVVIGSIMYDRKGNVIHPGHKKYATRYEPVFERGNGLNYFRKHPKRDGNNRPMFKVKKTVVRDIKLLQDGMNTHIFAFCPTRSGKGVGMVLPTLLTWPDSVMVNDPKGEAYALTAGFRTAAGQDVVKFEPACTNGTGARWNPLDEIRTYTLYDVSDAQMIMSMACDPKGEGLNDYFDKAGYEFLTALALHMRYAEKDGSLAGVAKFLGNPDWETDKQMYLWMQNATHDVEGKMNWVSDSGKPTKTHPMVANAASTMLKKEDKDRSGVLSTAKSLLSLYLDPIVAQNTCCSDFLVRDLMTGKKPVSLYYVVGPADMERVVPLTRLFYALFIRRNAADMEFKDGRSTRNYTYPLLMIIDEATSLKKLPILQEALGYVAGYGIRMFMLVQDITQVEELYGDKQSFDSGAETRIVYAPNKIETAEKLARMSGKTTITEENASHSGEVIGLKAGSVSLSTSKTARDLMTADEFLMLHDQDVVVFIKGQPPVYGRKAFYYENEVMLGRAKMPPPVRSARLREVAEALAQKEAPAEVYVETPADKWAASRSALKDRILTKVDGTMPVDSTSSAVDSTSSAIEIREAKKSNVQVNAAVVKSRSRYADKVKAVSDEETVQIKMLVANERLMDRVMRMSAF